MKIKHVIFLIILLLISSCFSGCMQLSNDQTNEGYGDQSNKKKESDQYQWSKSKEGPYLDRISYAISSDLLEWVDSKQVIVEHASVPGSLYRDGRIYLYFVDVSQDGKPEQVGLICSEDNGQTWLQKEYVQFEGIGEKIPVDPAPVLLEDGRIRLYYYDINEGRTSNNGITNKIYSAISQDGRLFVQEEGVRFERKDIFDPDAEYVNGLWHLYVGDVRSNQVVSAVSTDGLSFIEEGIAYTGGAVPDVFYKDGIYYLYTAGIDISTSNDGFNFIKTSSFRSTIGKITADPSVIQLSNGMYMMFYKTR